jgi:hypothetical protein
MVFDLITIQFLCVGISTNLIWHTSWKMNTQNFEKAKQKIHDIWHDQPKGAAFFAKMK